MKDTFLAIIAQIKTVETIKWVDEDTGQLDTGEKPAVKLPCALVTIDQVSEPLTSDERDVTSTITVRLAHNRLTDRPMMAEAEALASTTGKLDDLEALVDALSGFEDDTANCGPLVYRGFVSERRADGLSVKALTFVETHEEYPTPPTPDPVPEPDPEPDPEPAP